MWIHWIINDAVNRTRGGIVHAASDDDFGGGSIVGKF